MTMLKWLVWGLLHPCEPDVVLDDRQTLETWEADDDAVSTVQRATAENLPVGAGEWQAEP